MNEQLRREIDEIRAAGLYRECKVNADRDGRQIERDGKVMLDFSSNDYLGLSKHPGVVRAAQDALASFGCGGAASRLISGTCLLHRQLEDSIARLKRAGAALAFSSGYQANVGIISTILAQGDCIIMDRLNHASLWDAAKLSGARVFVYRHRDMNALEKILKRGGSYRRKMVVTDSVFSMDGDLAPLAEIVPLAKRYGAWVMVDEAHATGVFGARGAGLCEHFNVEDSVDIVMGTLSKALGSQGAFVCGSQELIAYLVNRCRAFIYTTALAPVCAAAALAAINVVNDEPRRRTALLQNAVALRRGLKKAGFDTLSSESQIVPVLFKTIEVTMAASLNLAEHGIYAPAIRPPTVPENECRLRFSLTSEHTSGDIKSLFSSLRSLRARAKQSRRCL